MDYIAKALSNPNCLSVVDFIHETAYPIDTFMIDRFWNTINDDQLIYVDDELIKWMGYANIESWKRKQDFIKLLKESSEGKDYHHYSNDEYKEFLSYAIAYSNIYPLPGEGKGLVNAKHLLLSPDTLRSTMMRVSTSRGDQVRKYYINLEKLFKTYVKYQAEYEKIKTQKELETAQKQIALQQNKILNIQNFVSNLKFLEKNEYIYIATTTLYAASNQYKVGRTVNLKSRLCTYNSGRANEDNMYYCGVYKCHDSIALESRIKSLLKNWRSNKNKEMYILNFDFLQKFIEFICNNDADEVDAVNKFMDSEYENSLSLPAVIPPPVVEFDGIRLLAAAPLPTTIEAAPASIPIPNPAPENNTTPAEQVQFLIASLHLTRAETIEILTSLLRPLIPGPAKSKDVNGVIRQRIGRGFKAAEWKAAVKEVASRIGLSIRYR
jgi:phage anti-repressor protein